MTPDAERNLVKQLVNASMSGSALATGWHLITRSNARKRYRVRFQRTFLDGSDPDLLIAVEARYRWTGDRPRTLKYTVTYREP